MACLACGGLQQGEVGFTLQTGCFCGTGDFTSIADVGGGLVGALGGCVDAIRDIKTQLGARQDEVRLIWTRWAGGQRGAGEEYVFKEVVIEPTPKITDLTALSRDTTSAGAAETGDLRISEISSRYHERELLGQIDGEPPGDDVNFYWEVTVGLENPDAVPVRRRFFPASPPSRNETRFEWVINVRRAHGDRVPSGLPRGSPEGLEDG